MSELRAQQVERDRLPYIEFLGDPLIEGEVDEELSPQYVDIVDVDPNVSGWPPYQYLVTTEDDEGNRAAYLITHDPRNQTARRSGGMTYRIETRHNDQWVLVQEESENWFDTREEAEQGIAELRKLGDDWASAEYRIVEEENEED